MSQAVAERDRDVHTGFGEDEVMPLAVPSEPGRARLEALAARLGVGVATVEGYLRAHGGMPAAAPDTERVDDVRLTRPSGKHDAPWVKRDKPRYFIAG